MKALPLRLHPGDDLRGALQQALADRGAEAAFVISAIGSLSRARVRFAGTDEAAMLMGELEILTLAGSLSPTGCHLHMSVADAAGRVCGGHVSPGCTVRTTVEVLLALLPDWRFSRGPDPVTGYAELVIRATGQDAG